MTLRRSQSIGRFLRARDGAAAVEFALLVPVLSAVAIGLMQYGGLIIAHQQMHNGLSSGAVYVMRGGTDSTAIHDVAYGAWPNKPADANVTVSTACTCSGTAVSCTSGTPCSDASSSYPQIRITIAGSGTYAGPFGNAALSASEIVRTQ